MAANGPLLRVSLKVATRVARGLDRGGCRGAGYPYNVTTINVAFARSFVRPNVTVVNCRRMSTAANLSARRAGPAQPTVGDQGPWPPCAVRRDAGVGVEYAKDGNWSSAHGARIILAAACSTRPHQLLMLSGVCDATI